MSTLRNRWYKDMVFYQVWPRSFCDGNGDGIGDLWGVLGKLDYIKSLGADGIWFNPLYVSPNADFGYDVSDYFAINPEYGDLDLFRQVLDAAHERGLKIIMDLVVDHTSTEHPWFKASRDPENPYHDYYFWREGKVTGPPSEMGGAGEPPNNWDSLFGGGAWGYDTEVGKWYLHMFDPKQADLNLDNPAVREEIKRIMRFWLDLGIDGFREDVITYISKEPSLPDDHVSPVGMRGTIYYNRGPRHLEYLREFRHDVLDRYDCMTVGECPYLGPDSAYDLLVEGPDQPLDMAFHFQHMEADVIDGNEYAPCEFDLMRLKEAFRMWQTGLPADAWDTLFMENHDRPRIISRYGSERFHDESGKMLAACFLFQRGTPFIYQGQEIGMTNISFDSIDGYQDTNCIGHYHDFCRYMPQDEALAIVQRASRDSARTPMQWTAGEYAGFSEVEPWFTLNPNYREINVTTQETDPDSLLNFYRKAIALRKSPELADLVRDGAYVERCVDNPDVFCYERILAPGDIWARDWDTGDRDCCPGDAGDSNPCPGLQTKRLLVICSFSEEPSEFEMPADFPVEEAELLLCNYADTKAEDSLLESRGERAEFDLPEIVLKPYETRVYSSF